MIRRRATWVALLIMLAACSTTVLPPAPRLPAQRVDDPMLAAVPVRNGECMSSADVFFVTPDLGAVDRAIVARGGRPGVLEQDRIFYYGPLEEAAVAFGGTALFVGPRGDAWIRTGPDTAHTLNSYITPGGRTVWVEGNQSVQRGC